MEVSKIVLFPVVATELHAQLVADAAAIGATVISVTCRRESKAATKSDVVIVFDAAPDQAALDASIAQYVQNNS
jgi:D-arabinose 5-phosphate isomerase GutQ